MGSAALASPDTACFIGFELMVVNEGIVNEESVEGLECQLTNTCRKQLTDLTKLRCAGQKIVWRHLRAKLALNVGPPFFLEPIDLPVSRAGFPSYFLFLTDSSSHAYTHTHSLKIPPCFFGVSWVLGVRGIRFSTRSTSSPWISSSPRLPSLVKPWNPRCLKRSELGAVTPGRQPTNGKLLRQNRLRFTRSLNR